MAAEEANNIVADLEKRIQGLEVGKEYDATKAAVQKVEMEFLTRLREIQQAMMMECGSGDASGSSAATGTGTAAKELEALRKENALLRKTNAKLEYRVQHVVGHLESYFAENQRLQAVTKAE